MMTFFKCSGLLLWRIGTDVDRAGKVRTGLVLRREGRNHEILEIHEKE
jgi:hypothetical protein